MEFRQCSECYCMKNIRKNKTMCKRCEDEFSLDASKAKEANK